MNRLLCLPALLLGAFTTATATQPTLLPLLKSVCSDPTAEHRYQEQKATREPIIMRGRPIGQRLTFTLSDKRQVKIEHREPNPRSRQTFLQLIDTNQRPQLRIVLDNDCKWLQARQIIYVTASDKSIAQRILHLDENLSATGAEDLLDPPVPPPDSQNRAGVRVAMVDAGVNYLLPHIAQRLARDKSGTALGYDFWDMDPRPFDANVVQSGFSVQRHGTRTASILLQEAPAVELVPYRYPRPDMTRMAQLIAHAQHHGVRIVGMPLGSNKYQDWATFSKVAEAHPQILFIASAGNNGRDIDLKPVYPAALEIDNLLVVSSADDFVWPAERSNFGRIAVDYLIPAEQLLTTDFSGQQITVSGSSYAVPRVAALAARILEKNPKQTVRELKSAIAEYAVRAQTGRFVAVGYLANPLADTAKISSKQTQGAPATTLDLLPAASKYALTISIAIIDSRWQQSTIIDGLHLMSQILQQCSIGIAVSQWQRLDVSAGLEHLATGPAHTLMRHLRTADNPNHHASAYAIFASDTRMQAAFDAEAFGAGNTRSRPWLVNTVWLTQEIEDVGVALAHEYFHVISNNGEHSDLPDNLMRARTDPANTNLTAAQCDFAIEAGLSLGLLQQRLVN